MSYIPSWCKMEIYTRHLLERTVSKCSKNISGWFHKSKLYQKHWPRASNIISLNPFSKQKAGQPITSLWLWTMESHTAHAIRQSQHNQNTIREIKQHLQLNIRDNFSWFSCASYRLGLAWLYNNHGCLTSRMCSSYCWKRRHHRACHSEGDGLHDSNETFTKKIVKHVVRMPMSIRLRGVFCCKPRWGLHRQPGTTVDTVDWTKIPNWLINNVIVTHSYVPLHCTCLLMNT